MVDAPYALGLPLPDDCMTVVYGFARPVAATSRLLRDVRFLACVACHAPVARLVAGTTHTFATVDAHHVYMCPLNWCGLDGTVACNACAAAQGTCGCMHIELFGLGLWSRVPKRRRHADAAATLTDDPRDLPLWT